ncbi:MAG: glutamate--tRNA ligase [Verrucomicrobiota bacterium]|jgi:glutamyl-tRNA synthetase
MDAPIRVRFAPSPTGYLHIGGARTALFNWLFARHHGGKFILRIEDTDTQRNSQEAIDVILRGLSWLGLDWDEGPTSGDTACASRGDRGPYFQSRRGDIYARRIQELRDKGLAYDRDGAVFFRMSREAITIPDLIIGDVLRPLTDREEADPDWVLVRSDGNPVFHLVNVVDDLEMGITHVIRGEDHLANTAKHIALFKAFGVEPPKYAHIPLILNPDGSKMSKRDHGAHVTNYQDDGFTPEAVLNYLALLGWAPADGKEFLPVAELIARFGLDRVNRSPAKFDVKKLEALHFEHTRIMEPALFVERGVAALSRAGIQTSGFAPEYIAAALETAREKGKLFKDLPAFVDFYFAPDDAVPVEAETRAKALNAAARMPLERLAAAFGALAEFKAAPLEAALKALAAELGVKVGALVQPVRAACTGKSVGPSLYHLLEVLGRERVQRRFAAALSQLPQA